MIWLQEAKRCMLSEYTVMADVNTNGFEFHKIFRFDVFLTNLGKGLAWQLISLRQRRLKWLFESMMTKIDPFAALL